VLTATLAIKLTCIKLLHKFAVRRAPEKRPSSICTKNKSGITNSPSSGDNMTQNIWASLWHTIQRIKILLWNNIWSKQLAWSFKLQGHFLDWALNPGSQTRQARATMWHNIWASLWHTTQRIKILLWNNIWSKQLAWSTKLQGQFLDWAFSTASKRQKPFYHNLFLGRSSCQYSAPVVLPFPLPRLIFREKRIRVENESRSETVATDPNVYNYVNPTM
jgi:hypothetical protein